MSDETFDRMLKVGRNGFFKLFAAALLLASTIAMGAAQSGAASDRNVTMSTSILTLPR